MNWLNWRCRQTITAASLDWYKTSTISEEHLILGRDKGFVEIYKLEECLKKRVEFRSHSPCFDYLRSTEIPESIDSLAVVPSGNRELLVLSSNLKTMKLWNVRSSYAQKEEDTNVLDCGTDFSSSQDLCEEGPIEAQVKEGSAEQLEKIFSRGLEKKPRVSLERERTPEKTYNIHSVSVSSNGEQVLISDELSVSLYSAELEEKWKAVDIKPGKTEELCKIITTAKFVDRSSTMLAYGTSSGTVEIHDMRESTHCEASRSLNSSNSSWFYGEVICPVSDVFFVTDTVVATRNLEYVILHDMRAASSVLKEIDVYPLVKKKIPDLYDTDEVFSKFKISVLENKVYTGSFNTVLAEIDATKMQINRTFLEPEMEKATRIVDRKKVACISVDGDCMAATVSNQCYIFRSEAKNGAADKNP